MEIRKDVNSSREDNHSRNSKNKTTAVRTQQQVLLQKKRQLKKQATPAAAGAPEGNTISRRKLITVGTLRTAVTPTTAATQEQRLQSQQEH